jgi:aminomuconate-semialdehyde/2-hydroxymuconate-6-semialdehyde dehydrogenase
VIVVWCAIGHDGRMSTTLVENLIGGEFVPPVTGRMMDCVNPATGEAFAHVALSGREDVDRAVQAAKRAFNGWRRTPVSERARLLNTLADLIDQHAERLAIAETNDSGKPITLARSVDIPRSAQNFRYFAGAIQHTSSPMHRMDDEAINYTLRHPRGVAGCISPWNLPLYLLTWKIAPALATGNTVVAKPSEITPMTAFMLSELIVRAGFPPGVINIVHGDGGTAGVALVEHPDVPTLSFTGSTRVGRFISETASKTFKRVSLELGGKNPFVIFEDADLDQAIPAAARAAFTNGGQICLCGSRLLVHRSVMDRVIEGLSRLASERVIGDPIDAATEHGALVSMQHLEKVEWYVQSAVRDGAVVHAGGGRVPPDRLPERVRHGAFFQPTVLSGLANTCDAVQEEIFGPVVTVQPFDTEQEAIELANSTKYGLAASVWTSNLTRAHRVSAQVEAGIVWVNCWMLRDLRTPFGGTKQSGYGREGGEWALNFFTEPKNVCIKI